MVPTKYPLNVKLELFTTLECQSWDELCVPIFWGFLGFYSNVESISYACATSLFLIGKIFINVHIFQNPPYVRVLFVVELYGLGFLRVHIMISRVPRGFFGPSTLGSSIRASSTTGSSKEFVLLDESVNLMSVHTWSIHIWQLLFMPSDPSK